MKTYFAVVHKDDNSAYGVSFPDLPGCFSAADRLEDVVPNACEALALWFEDNEDKRGPSNMEWVRANALQDLREGAFLIAVPLISNAGKPVRVNVSLDRGMLDAIDTAAAARRLTRSAFLAEAARKEIQGAH